MAQHFEFSHIGILEAFHGNGSKNYDISSDYVYHYTSKTKAKRILHSEQLFPSTDEYNDCLFGIGVYFTSLTPNNSKRDILFNNYGDETQYNECNANAWVRIHVHKLSDVQRINCGRNVWIYPTHSALDLSQVDAEVSCLKCDFGSRSTTCALCDGNVTYDITCNRCDGSGTFQHYKECRTCYGNGSGQFICPNCENGKTSEECDECDGDGLNYWGECEECEGEGTIHEVCDNCNGNWNREDCPSCNETGNFYWNHQEQCNNCGGSGDVTVQCSGCNGGKVPCNECGGNDVICL